MTLAQQPMAARAAPSACPLNLFLPRSFSPLTTTSPAKHHRTLVWPSYIGVRNALGQRLLRSVPPLTLPSPLSTPSCRPRFSSWRSRSQSSIPPLLKIPYPLAFDLIYFAYYSSSLVSLYPTADTLCAAQSILISSTLKPLGSPTTSRSAAPAHLRRPHSAVTTPKCLSSMAKNGPARPASRVTE
jgi:hypothetical protein